MIRCKRCGAEIPTYYKLRKWCFSCRKELINERARLRNRNLRLLRTGDLDLKDLRELESLEIEPLKLDKEGIKPSLDSKEKLLDSKEKLIKDEE